MALLVVDLDELEPRRFAVRDLFAGLVKAALTGWVIAGIGCSQGLRAQGGALGVGRAVRSAVISATVKPLYSAATADCAVAATELTSATSACLL